MAEKLLKNFRWCLGSPGTHPNNPLCNRGFGDNENLKHCNESRSSAPSTELQVTRSQPSASAPCAGLAGGLPTVCCAPEHDDPPVTFFQINY